MSQTIRISRRIVAVLACTFAVLFAKAGFPLVIEGETANVAPFGEGRLSEDGKEYVVLWEDARDIHRVVVRWAEGAAPSADAVRLEYWQSGWPHRRIPRDQKSGAGSSGWLDVGDWYKGQWRAPDANVERNGAVWTYTFNPVNAKEFKDVGEFDARYRTTFKLRLASDAALPKIESVEAFTDSVWDVAEVDIVWGGIAEQEQTWDGRLEVFNGWVESIAPLAGGGVQVGGDRAWRSTVRNRTDGIRARIRYAKPAALNSFDETIVTVRNTHAPFSFAMANVLRANRGTTRIEPTREGRVSLSIRDAELQNVVRLLAKQAGMNIVMNPRQVQGLVTVELRDVDPRDALGTVLRANQLELVEDRSRGAGPVIVVTGETEFPPKDKGARSPRATGDPIFIPAFGVLVKPADVNIRYEDMAEVQDEIAANNLYNRVFLEPEQTLTRAWNDMPPKAPHYIPISFEGSRQHFRVDEHGEVNCFAGWLRRIKGKDSPRALWDGDSITYRFGLAESKAVKRGIQDGDLPIIASAWERDGIEYEQTACAMPLAGVPRAGGVAADDPLILMVRIAMKNPGANPATARLAISSHTREDEPLTLDKDLLFAPGDAPRRLRMRLDTNGAGAAEARDGRIAYSVELAPGKTHAVYAAIPFITLTERGEWEQLRAIQFDEAREAVARYWRNRFAQGARIATPEPMINDFYRAHAGHQLINCEREVGSNFAMPKVGTFHYGVYSNESVMMLLDLECRGFHDVARRAYDMWLHYQGSVGLPGDYSTQEGELYGAGGYEAGGYNQHHGWALWGMGEHYWFTRDRDWLAQAAPGIIKACDWIANERRRSNERAARGGLRAIEKGLLPPGSLEDIGDWRCWSSTNIYCWWGMNNAARALADIGHPEAKRLLAEADSYRNDIRAAFLEAMHRSPVVQLRDGSWAPHIPSDVHRRGRSFGWLTETLEGAIHFVRVGLIAPDDPIAAWIVQDYEDNLYISEQFGYDMKGEEFERWWFSRGGISMQANLLHNPIVYLLRDEPKHFLRAYFNAFAASYFPDTRMMTEHALPNVGDWRGDHYKSSDEANSTYWLRCMFVQERGDDLLLGAAVPTYWLADGKEIGIENAHTHFGPMSISMRSRVAAGEIEMKIDPPKRNPPKRLVARFRHPEGKPIKSVTVNGKPHEDFDPTTQAVMLSGVSEATTILARF